MILILFSACLPTHEQTSGFLALALQNTQAVKKRRSTVGGTFARRPETAAQPGPWHRPIQDNRRQILVVHSDRWHRLGP